GKNEEAPGAKEPIEIDISEGEPLELEQGSAAPPPASAPAAGEVEAADDLVVESPTVVVGEGDVAPSNGEPAGGSPPRRAPSAEPIREEEAKAAVARAQSGGGPPGLRTKKDSESAEVVLLDRPKTPAPPQGNSRIWIPPAFGPSSATPGAQAP